MTALEDAWAQLDAPTPCCAGMSADRLSRTGWPAAQWEQYAFDTSERPKAGKRTREWSAIAPTEVGVILSMERCPREVRAGRVPKLTAHDGPIVCGRAGGLASWCSLGG